MQNNQSVDNYA
jgi:hypothetical protein